MFLKLKNNIKILERPFSLAYRSIAIGLLSRPELFQYGGNIIASSDHRKLIDLKNEKRNNDIYIWIILDGFFAASDVFHEIVNDKKYKFISRIFIVGDLGSIIDLAQHANQPLELLLDSSKCQSSIKIIEEYGFFERINIGIPPAVLYKMNDLLKNKSFYESESINKLKRSKFLFAGNDGIYPILDIFLMLLGKESKKFHDHIFLQISNYCRNVDENIGHEDLNLILMNSYDILINHFERLMELINVDRRRKIFSNGLKLVLYKSIFRHIYLRYLNSIGYIDCIFPPQNLSIYTRTDFNNCTMLDFGGINGFEEIYPRRLDCILYKKDIFTINVLTRNAYMNQKISLENLMIISKQLDQACCNKINSYKVK